MLHSIFQPFWKTQQWPQGWQRSVFIPIPKKSNVKECSNLCTIVLISHASKAVLKILQTRLQQYMNWEIPDVPAGFRKGRGTRYQTDNISWIIRSKEKQENSKRTSTSASLTTLNLCLCGSQHIVEILKEMEIPDHLNLPPEKLVCKSKVTVRTRSGAIDWFRIGKGVCQGCISSPCLFNLYAEYIMWNARLDEAQAGIKIARRNISNLYMQITPPLWHKAKRN